VTEARVCYTGLFKQSLSLLPVLPQGGSVRSRWSALLCGMDFVGAAIAPQGSL